MDLPPKLTTIFCLPLVLSLPPGVQVKPLVTSLVLPSEYVTFSFMPVVSSEAPFLLVGLEGNFLITTSFT